MHNNCLSIQSTSHSNNNIVLKLAFLSEPAEEMVNRNSPKKSPLKKKAVKDKSNTANSEEMLNKNSPKKSPSKKNIKKEKAMTAQKKKILDKETIIINHKMYLGNIP